jgi:sphinganine-1-phosphate aldolase
MQWIIGVLAYFRPIFQGLGMLFGAKILHDLYYHDWTKTFREQNRVNLNFIRKLPWIGAKINKQIDKDILPTTQKLDHEIHENWDHRFDHLPEDGASLETLESSLNTIQSKYPPGELYKISGSVYVSQENQKLKQVSQRVHEASQYTNPLHSNVWPNINQYSSQIIQMCFHLMQHEDPNSGFGAVTAGGTYSIIEAVKAYRNRALAAQSGVLGQAWHYLFPATPEMIVPSTAHAAFEKAADLLGIKLVKIPVNPNTQEADILATERAITKNTILIVGSAPSYPTGTLDNIEALGQFALKYKIGLHVDACLGGFVLPFVKDQLPYRFDFSVPGVTSLSMDTHKQGGGDKGSSVILYRDYDTLGKYQISTHMDWSGGLYATATMAGSQSGYAITSAFASLQSLGAAELRSNAKGIVNLRQTCQSIVQEYAELSLLGRPDGNILALQANQNFKGQKINIHLIADYLHEKGWVWNVLPNGVHFCLTGVHVAAREKFLKEFQQVLAEGVDYARKNHLKKPRNEGGIYCTMASLPKTFKPLQEDMAKQFIAFQARTTESGPVPRSPDRPRRKQSM